MLACKAALWEVPLGSGPRERDCGVVSAMIRIVIASDSRLYREGLATALSRVPSIAVVALVQDRHSCLDVVDRKDVEVVLLDIAMAESRQTSRELAHRREVWTVALGVEETEDEIIAYAEAGISGYITRSASLDDLVAATQRAARGEATCSPRIAATLLERIAFLASERRLRPIGKLTTREREIVTLLDDGLSNKEIAQRLCIEVATVKNHVHNILGKLDLKRRGQAGRWARYVDLAHAAGRGPERTRSPI